MDDYDLINDYINVQLIGGPYCGEWRQIQRGLEYLVMPEPLEPIWDVNKEFDPFEVVKSLTYHHMPACYDYNTASFMVYKELTTDEALQIISRYTGWPYVPQS